MRTHIGLWQAILVSLALHGLLFWMLPVRKSTQPAQELPLEISLLAPPASSEPAPAQSAPKPAEHHHSKPVSLPSPDPTPKSNSRPAPQARLSAEELRAATLLEARQDRYAEPAQRLRNIAPHDRNLVFAAYEESYRRKVENVGSVNYPAPINGRPLSGAVRMRAVVGADGHLIEVAVESSSGVVELDQAARRIVEMAAPFQPFSPVMKSEADRVSIACTFRFSSATNGVSSRP